MNHKKSQSNLFSTILIVFIYSSFFFILISSSTSRVYETIKNTIKRIKEKKKRQN